MAMLAQLGPQRAMPMGGYRAVDWPEIAGFDAAMGPLKKWELSLLRDMARAYCTGFEAGGSPLGIMPSERG